MRTRSISLPIALASIAVALSIALLVGWTIVFARYIKMTREVEGTVPILVVGIVFFVFIMVAMMIVSLVLVREILDSRKHTRFLDSVTHELRSPLASMKLSAETLGRDSLAEEQRERLRGMILKDVERLRILVDDILAAGRLEQRSEATHANEVHLAELVDSIAESVRRRHGIAEGELENRIASDLVIRSDRASLRLILSNLIDNAVKYSDRPAAVVVDTGTASNGCLEIRVQDRGIGIRGIELKRIRRRFYRVPSEEVRQRHGTGLGLYVVDGLVRRLDGRLKLRSEGLGKGTTAVVRLPVDACEVGGAR